ncbi:hypothetical protein ACJX0J_031145, partial [Zea mays]
LMLLNNIIKEIRIFLGFMFGQDDQLLHVLQGNHEQLFIFHELLVPHKFIYLPSLTEKELAYPEQKIFEHKIEIKEKEKQIMYVHIPGML